MMMPGCEQRALIGGFGLRVSQHHILMLLESESTGVSLEYYVWSYSSSVGWDVRVD